MMRAAAQIGIAPHRFWQLSLREWISLSGSSASCLLKGELAALMEKNPDTEK